MSGKAVLRPATAADAEAIGWWSLDLQEKADEPPPPRDSAAVRRDPAWQQALDAGLPLLRVKEWPD